MGKGTNKVTTKSTSALFVIVFVLIVIALLLQIAGFVAPGWYHTNYKDPEDNEIKESYHGGLWYMVNCMGECETFPMNDEKAGTRFFAHKVLAGEKDNFESGFYADYMLKLQVGCTIALGLTIISLILLIAARLVKKYLSSTSILAVVILLTLASGVLSLAICCNEASKQMDEAGKWGSHTGLRLVLPNPISIPYSLILFGIAGILLCIMFILVVIMLICNAYGLQKEGGFIISKHQEAMVSGNGSSPVTVTHETTYLTEKPNDDAIITRNNNYEVKETITTTKPQQQQKVIHTLSPATISQQQPQFVMVPASQAHVTRTIHQQHRTPSGRYVIWTGTNRSKPPAYTSSHVTSLQNGRY